MLDGVTAHDWLQLAAYAVIGLLFVLSMKSDIRMLAKDISLHGAQIAAQSEEIKQLANIVKDQAVMNERMNHFDTRLEALARGEGWIMQRRSSVEGQY